MTNQYQYRTITKTCPQQSHPCPSWHGNFIQFFSFWCAWDQKGWRTWWTMGSEGKRPRNSCSNTCVLSEYPWFGDRFPCVGAPSKNSQCLCASTCKIQSCSVIASRSHNRHRPDCGRVIQRLFFVRYSGCEEESGHLPKIQRSSVSRLNIPTWPAMNSWNAPWIFAVEPNSWFNRNPPKNQQRFITFRVSGAFDVRGRDSLPSGKLTWLLKMAIYSGFSH